MKLSLALLLVSTAPTNANLRGSVVEKDTSVEGWGQLKCMFEAFSNKEKCADAVNDDGEPCSYCTMEGGGQEAGLCVDPAVAPEMEQMNPSVSCDPDATSLHLVEEEAADEVKGWEQLKCTFGAFSNREKCFDSTNGDGAKCSYCFVKDSGDPGDFGGLCVDAGLASQMEQMNPALECVDESSVSILEEEEDKDVKGWGQLKCMFEAFSNEEKCAEALNDAGEPCSYCTMVGGGQEAGLCVDPAVAPQMEQMNPSVSCNPDATSLHLVEVEEEDKEEATDEVKGWDQLKCTFGAFSNKEKCAESTNGDGAKCSYCFIKDAGDEGDFGGLCVDPGLAPQMEQMNPALECDNDDSVSILEVVEEEEDEEKDVKGWGQLKCMFEAFSNEEKCAEALNGDGEPCSYCTMESGGDGSGLCVDPAVAPQMEQMNPSISCNPDATSLVEDEKEVEIVDLGLPDYHDYKCAIKGMTDARQCHHTTIYGSDEMCEYCEIDGPFGHSGLCVSPEHAEKLMNFNPDVKCSTSSKLRGEVSVSLETE